MDLLFRRICMTTTQKTLLLLIKSAITDKAESLPESYSLEDIFKYAQKRHLIPLVYTGAIRCGISKQDPIMLKMLQYAFRYIISSEKQMAELTRLLDAFDKNGIDYLPIKGSHLKHLYPKPELRIMGDADILIRVEQYEKIVSILKELEFIHVNDCDHHFAWHTSSLTLELHQKLVSSVLTNYNHYYEDSWRFASLVSGTRYEFRSSEDEFVYIFAHFAKHYILGGIGCRHLIDLWVFRRCYPDMDETYILSQLKELQLVDFYKNILKVIQVWFENDTLDEKAAFISEFIFASGNWGSAKTHALSTSVKSMQIAKSRRFYKIHKLIGMVFPKKEGLALRYPWLRRHPHFYLFFYPIRIVDTIINRPKNVRKHIADISYSTPDKVNSYEESLSYVGLHFDVKN